MVWKALYDLAVIKRRLLKGLLSTEMSEDIIGLLEMGHLMQVSKSISFRTPPGR